MIVGAILILAPQRFGAVPENVFFAPGALDLVVLLSTGLNILVYSGGWLGLVAGLGAHEYFLMSLAPRLMNPSVLRGGHFTLPSPSR